MRDEKQETIEDIVRELRSEPLSEGGAKPWLHYLADRIESAWKRERSQAKTASAYEYAVQEKFKGKWLVDLNGFSSLDEAEDYMNTMCEMNPGYEFRVVRRKTTDWEVVE